MMDRRNFFRLTIGGVAAATAVRTWPFRVYSFPTNIVIAPVEEAIAYDYSFYQILDAAMRMPRKRGPWVSTVSSERQPWQT